LPDYEKKLNKFIFNHCCFWDFCITLEKKHIKEIGDVMSLLKFYLFIIGLALMVIFLPGLGPS